MKNIKGFKFRIYPKSEHVDLLERSFGHTRFLYNHLLGISIKAYDKYKDDNNLPKPKVSGYDFVKQIPSLYSEYPWLNEISSVALQQKALDLGRAFTNFFRDIKENKISFPKFKKKSSRQSFTLMKTAFQVKDNDLYIAKSKLPIKVRWSRDLPSYPSSCVISKDPDGRYYVSFICECDPVLTNGDGKIGIDLGISNFAIISNGEIIENPNLLKRSLKRLKRVQQNHSRKEKGSKNRNKERIKVAKLHKKITNQRNDFLHKLSRRLVNENQVISLESLKVSNMIRNRHLARSIADVSWGIFFNYLQYKALESHKCNIVLMHPFYPSSKMCSNCKTKYDELKLSERKWTCKVCNTTHDRDLNASKNILRKGVITFKDISPKGNWINKLIICNNELV